jgi:TfoX/Sxy family transcriptional regulator of competence genes
MSVENIRQMAENYKVEKCKETGKFKLYNKAKKTFTKKMFSTKDMALKAGERYTAFAESAKSRKKAKVEPIKEEKE